jgi:ribosomal protein S4
MAMKRYLPKYKKLLRFRYPLWFEKRVKIKNFEKQKWEKVKKLYYPRRLKAFSQTTPAYRAVKHYYKDQSIRAFKVYRFLLQDKQKLQTYYGVGKFRYYQLKNMARKVYAKRKIVDPGKALLFLLENRLDVLLYRLLIVNSIPHARKLIQDKRVAVDSKIIQNTNYLIKATNIISMDLFMKKRLLDIYLRGYMPYFYFRNKSKRSVLKEQRRKVWENPFLTKGISYYLKSILNTSKNSVKNEIIFTKRLEKNRKKIV